VHRRFTPHCKQQGFPHCDQEAEVTQAVPDPTWTHSPHGLLQLGDPPVPVIGDLRPAWADPLSWQHMLISMCDWPMRCMQRCCANNVTTATVCLLSSAGGVRKVITGQANNPNATAGSTWGHSHAVHDDYTPTCTHVQHACQTSQPAPQLGHHCQPEPFPKPSCQPYGPSSTSSGPSSSSSGSVEVSNVTRRLDTAGPKRRPPGLPFWPRS
jgi:hypothetical protein